MSKISITGASTGTATFTLESPATSTNRTLTLPDETGTILTNATTAGFPAGSVLQVVSANTVTDTVITATSYTDTTLTASITPSSATSKILVIVTQAFLIYREASGINGGMRIVRGATAIAAHGITPAINTGLNSSSFQFARGVWSMCYLDSPATTSSTAYKTQALVNTSANVGQIRLQQDSEISTITLMEIAA